jgi:pimeloyl-ACP methyl ester carboxylesterase
MLHPKHHDDLALLEIGIRMGLTVGVDGFVRQEEAIITRIDSRPNLPAISVPTLVLVGDRDSLTPPERSEEMAGAIPGARLVVVPECGHISTLEQPETTNRALIDWLTA